MNAKISTPNSTLSDKNPIPNYQNNQTNSKLKMNSREKIENRAYTLENEYEKLSILDYRNSLE